MRLLIATTNPGKAREFREMLGADRFDWIDLAALPKTPPPEETGDTFIANAALKATFYAREHSCWTLADDSGLEVDALDRKPGVHSARWAQLNNAGAGDDANNALLLRQLDSTPDDRRSARFVCALALADPQGRVILNCRDTVEGAIARQPAGDNGFGYDPLFRIDSLGRTTAQLQSHEKNRISHRGKALRQMAALMERMGLSTAGAAPGEG